MEGDVALASLGLAEEGLVHVTAFGGCLLGEAEFGATGSEAGDEGFGGGDKGGGMVGTTTYVPIVPIQSSHIPTRCVLLGCVGLSRGSPCQGGPEGGEPDETTGKGWAVPP